MRHRVDRLIGNIPSTRVSKLSGSKWLPASQATRRRGDVRQRDSFHCVVWGPSKAGSEFPSQHVKTKAAGCDFCHPNQTIISVNARLPKGNSGWEIWPQASG